MWPKLNLKNYRPRRKRRRRDGIKRAAVSMPEELPIFDCHSPPELLLDFYRKHQVLHVRPKSNNAEAEKVPLPLIRELLQKNPTIIEDSWCVENEGSSGREELTPENLFKNISGKESSKRTHLMSEGSFYCSTILQNDDAVVERFLEKVPCKSPAFFSAWENNLVYSKPIWLFIGQNVCRHERDEFLLEGRREHTDSVSHSGTWHYQLSGRKIWNIRPLKDSKEWNGLDVSTQEGEGRLAVTCLPGDLFLINTRLWWHHTQIPDTSAASNKLSCSYARDFFCKDASLLLKKIVSKQVEISQDKEETFKNVDALYASRAVNKGEIVLTESELPDCSLPRSLKANCEVVELENGEGALVALRSIQAGDFLAVLPSSDEEVEEDEEEEDDVVGF